MVPVLLIPCGAEIVARARILVQDVEVLHGCLVHQCVLHMPNPFTAWRKNIEYPEENGVLFSHPPRDCEKDGGVQF